ncbi:hypothetical protein [Methylomonas sp. AM2-LC]|uniref:hypothetical protein n=1 Tax=Methylomonas sp. AM2-LC TaxID=3153301 RepID=UPI003264ED3A
MRDWPPNSGRYPSQTKEMGFSRIMMNTNNKQQKINVSKQDIPKKNKLGRPRAERIFSDEKDRIAHRYAVALHEANPEAWPTIRLIKFHQKFAESIVEMNAYELSYLGDTDSKVGRQLFMIETGFDLPEKDPIRCQELLREWAGISEIDHAINMAKYKVLLEFRKASQKKSFVKVYGWIKDTITKGFNVITTDENKNTYLENSQGKRVPLSGADCIFPLIQSEIALNQLIKQKND